MVLKRAPAIMAGTPISIADLHNSRTELVTAKTLLKTGDQVTPEEISSLEIRHQGVLIEHVIATTPALAPGPVGNMAVLIQSQAALRESLQGVLDSLPEIQGNMALLPDIQRNMALLPDIQRNTADIQRRLTLLEDIPESIAVIQARLLNESIRRRNKRAMNTHAEEGIGHPLLALRKEIRGLGVGLPGMVPILAFPAINVGDPVGPPFPTTTRAMFSLSALAINRLSMIFNDDFGITQLDTLAQQRAKFHQFVTGY